MSDTELAKNQCFESKSRVMDSALAVLTSLTDILPSKTARGLLIRFKWTVSCKVSPGLQTLKHLIPSQEVK